MNEDGTSIPGGGVLTSYEPPSGPGIRLTVFDITGTRLASCTTRFWPS